MGKFAAARRSRITPEREAEMYAAALDLLREVGYDSLTMQAVATRSRSSKATLYRLWNSKAELVAKAIRGRKQCSSSEDVDAGSLRGDLHALTMRYDDRELEQDCALMRGLAMAVHANPDLFRAFKEHLIAPWTANCRLVLQRAIERDEIAADNPALGYITHMMIGAFTARRFIDEQPPTRDFLVSYVDAVILPALRKR